METHLIQKFERMGARAKVEIVSPRRWRNHRTRQWQSAPANFSIDVGHDRHGEFFELRIPEDTSPELEVIDLKPELRHLLLLARQDNGKDKFLCGHDERHWFTCAVPGSGVSSVRTAMEALKPDAVLNSSIYQSLSGSKRLRRHNAAFIRQGEWFFVPQPDLIVPERLTLRREPLSRGGRSKSHWLEEAYRIGGQVVYVRSSTGETLSYWDHVAHLTENPKAKSEGWRRMVRDSELYARGAVSHSDHATIHLRGWHRVLMNTEGQARAAKNVAFLD